MNFKYFLRFFLLLCTLGLPFSQIESLIILNQKEENLLVTENPDHQYLRMKLNAPIQQVILSSDGKTIDIIAEEALYPVAISSSMAGENNQIEDNALGTSYFTQVTPPPPPPPPPTPVRTRLRVSSTPNPSLFGEDVELIAEIRPIRARGTVIFLDGRTKLGEASIKRHGEAKITVSSLSPGLNTIIAQYGGEEGLFLPSEASFTQIVENDFIGFFSQMPSLKTE